jgi:serine/threonine-protein kinase ATR
MNIPNASPFPPTFDSNAGDASPKRFLDFLRRLISQDLSDDSGVRIPAADRDSWVEVITSLSDHFLTPLPSPRDVPWNAMHEKVKLVEIILDLLQRVTDRVDALYAGPGDLAKKTFVRLVGLCSGLDIWVEVDVLEEEGIPTPSDLRHKAFQAAVGILRWLGSNVASVGGSEEPTWRILRNILVECLEVSHGMQVCFNYSAAALQYLARYAVAGGFSTGNYVF